MAEDLRISSMTLTNPALPWPAAFEQGRPRAPGARARQETAGLAVLTTPCAKEKVRTRRSSQLLPGLAVSVAVV
ncbi:hypothetical protein [Streptomyces lydicus]|uniref:hypothetical protein n=1 Tax=Streptomyces lydicus TaxID=47763 RepID=UPI00286FC2A0|nr:hypothetical protein [Streptomyces lydicus]